MNLDKLVNDWRRAVRHMPKIENPATEQLCAAMGEYLPFAIQQVDAVIETKGEEWALETFYRASELIARRDAAAFKTTKPDELRTIGGMFLHMARADADVSVAFRRLYASGRKRARAVAMAGGE